MKPLFCAKCRTRIEAGEERCSNCGHPADESTSRAALVQPTAAMTADELAKAMVTADPIQPASHRPAQHSRSTAAIDMRNVLDERVPTSVRIAQPGAPPAPSSALNQTDIEGLEPIRLTRDSRIGPNPKRKTNLSRTLPLLLVLIAAVGALVFGGWHIVSTSESVANEREQNDDARVRLASIETIVGLTDDNRHTVLNMCYRVSSNPNYECRTSHLEELGEFPHRVQAFPEMEADTFEVSNRRFDACVSEGYCEERAAESCQFYTHRALQPGVRPPDRLFREDYPAVCVTRDQAESFCRWSGGRLPTPEEWERLARGGDDRLAPWGSLWAPDLINWAETDMGGFPVVGHLDGYDLTAAVDHYPNGTTADGIYNMLGNVSEWVAPAEGMIDGVRGGSYRTNLRNLRATYQWEVPAERARTDVGFRCIYPVGDSAEP